MTTNGVNFQKAVDYCLNNKDVTVQESAAKFGVDVAQLSEFITKAMNPNGGGEVGDFAQFSNHIANKEIAHAQVKIGTEEYTISIVGKTNGKIYDKDGNIVPFSQFDKDYAFTVDDDGRINMKLKPGSKAPTAKIIQKTNSSGGWFDTFKNFWRRNDNKDVAAETLYDGGSATTDDVVIVANRTNATSGLAVNEVDNEQVNGVVGGKDDENAMGVLNGDKKAIIGGNDNITVNGAKNGIKGGHKVLASKMSEQTSVNGTYYDNQLGGTEGGYVTMDDILGEYNLDKKQTDKALSLVNKEFTKLPPKKQKKVTDLANSAMAKAEAGDTKGAKEDMYKLSKILDKAFGKIGILPNVPEEARFAMLAIGVIGSAVLIKGALASVSVVNGVKTAVNVAKTVDIASKKAMAKAASLLLPTAMVLASCNGIDDFGGKKEINQNVNITINSSLEDALDALIQGQKVQTEILQKILEREIENGMTAKEILDLCGGNAQLLAKILESMTENNNLLKEVKNSINSGTENIMNALVDIKGSVDNIADLIKEFPEYTTQLNEIISGIKTGNKSMSEIKDLIEQVLNQAVKNGDTQVSILNKLNEIQNANKSDGEKLADMLKLLGEIKVTLDGIAGDLKAHFKNDATVNKYLEQILAEAKKNNAKTDATNELLQKLYTLVEKLGSKGDAMGKEIINAIANLGLDMTANFDKLLDAVNNGNVKLDNITALLQKINANVVKNGEDGKKLGDQILNYIAAVGFETNQNFSKLLDAVNNGNVKLDDIKELITQLTTQVKQNGEDGKKLGKEILDAINKHGVDMNTNFAAVLEAINKGVAGADSLRDLLEKVLEKQDKNTKAIIEAIGNIKVGSGGTVDLSSIEKMLAELLKQSQKNGNILSNIDAKTDVIATTTKSILEALNKEFGKNDERYKNINNLLTVIANKNNGNGNDKVLLEKLDKILQKLDEIKDAIKNHKVEVDVTGKVTCECNCGSKHEGILGDLNDLLG